MSDEKPLSVIASLSRALHRIRSTPPRVIASPRTQPRRAAVALIIRIVPASNATPPPPSTSQPTITEFFDLDWVKDPNARPEILFVRRDSAVAEAASLDNGRPRNTREAHVAFPGGRTEKDDEGGLYTAMRQTWEEIGIDLAEREYTCIGQLDDREITTSLGKRLLMILSPYVFLQLCPQSPTTDPAEGTTLHWTPLASVVAPPKWSYVTVDAASRMAPKHSVALRLLVQVLVGSMQFPAIVIEPSSTEPLPAPVSDVSKLEKGATHAGRRQTLKLWGLSLGMTLDLLSYMIPAEPDLQSGRRSGYSTPAPLSPLQLPYRAGDELRIEDLAPSLASIFPKFSYPDVNFWIWVFGRRYREVVRGWEASVRSGGSNDRRINWSGSALSTYYAAVRKALVVVIVARALGILFGLLFAGWWVFA